MTTAAVLPLLYFEVCNRLMRFWAKALRRSIKRDLSARPIKFYYQVPLGSALVFLMFHRLFESEVSVFWKQ